MIMPAVSKKIGWSVKRATTEYPHAASDPTDMSVSIVASKARSLFSAIRWNWDPKGEHHRRREGRLPNPRSVGFGNEHREGHQRRGERRGEQHVAPLIEGFARILVSRPLSFVAGLDLPDLVADPVDGSLECRHIGRPVDDCARFHAGEIHDGFNHAFLAAEDSLDSKRARRAGHSVDVECDGFG